MIHDLAALNIQRGRDLGIGGYNQLREVYGLSVIGSFNDLPTSQENITKLQNLYDTVNDIDPWVGAIIENHLSGSSVGPLLNAILVEQFDRLRKGDRFWFEIDPGLSDDDITEIKNTTLSDILNRNTSNHTFQSNVFVV